MIDTITLARKIINGHRIQPSETQLLFNDKETAIQELFTGADLIRRHYFGNRITLCGIVNAKSGKCSEDCRFCSQSVHYHTNIPEHPLLDYSDLAESADTTGKNKASRFGVVTSGKGCTGQKEFSKVCEHISRLSKEKAGLRIDASLGTLTLGQAKQLKEAGLTRYHHNLETSRKFYPRICSTHGFDLRLETVRNAAAAGLEVCCGGIFGVGESWQDRIDLAFEIAGLPVVSVPINFLNPVPGTPLQNTHELTPQDCLRIIALFRFVLPEREISICGGRDINLRDMQSWIFFAGASGCMVGDYLTTKGRKVEDDLRMFLDLGMEF